MNSIQYNVPTTGTTVTATAQVQTLVLNPAGTLVSLAIRFPPSPVDGQVFNVCISQIITTLTTATTDGSTIDGSITTTAINSSGGWVYAATPTTWFKSH